MCHATCRVTNRHTTTVLHVYVPRKELASNSSSELSSSDDSESSLESSELLSRASVSGNWAARALCCIKDPEEISQ